MKKLLTATTGNQLVRRLSTSILVLFATVLFACAFWTAGTLSAKDPSPTASPGDFEGASDPNKCTICHAPPGNPANAKTLTIGCSAVDAHLRNHPGDCLGPCPCQPTPKTNP